MSCIVMLPIVLPALPIMWPVVAAAATAAAAALGYAAAGTATGAGVEVKAGTEVDIQAASAEAVTAGLTLGEVLTFTKGEVSVRIGRDNRGKVFVKVHSPHHSKAELQAIGQELCNKIAQQYAYHRLVSEMKQRNFTVLDETVEEDGTVRLKVRVYQGEQ